jgi:phosphinothricin acetyltransferase
MTITIRPAQEQDAEAVRAIYAPFCERTAISFEFQAPTADEMRSRILAILRHYPWLICQIGQEVTGYAYASGHRTREAYQWSVDVSVYVGEGHQRAGVGRALYTSLFHILRLQGFVNAYAGITLPNPASVGLHESFGFEPVGVYRRVGYKHGRWHDVGWWQMALGHHGLDPGRPEDFLRVVNLPACAEALGAGTAGAHTLTRRASEGNSC